MEELDLDLKVSTYGPSTTHWWALSVPCHPTETISSAPTTSLSDSVSRDDLAAKSVSTYPVFEEGKYVLSLAAGVFSPLSLSFSCNSRASCASRVFDARVDACAWLMVLGFGRILRATTHSIAICAKFRHTRHTEAQTSPSDGCSALRSPPVPPCLCFYALPLLSCAAFSSRLPLHHCD